MIQPAALTSSILAAIVMDGMATKRWTEDVRRAAQLSITPRLLHLLGAETLEEAPQRLSVPADYRS